MDCLPASDGETYIEALDAYAGQLPFIPNWEYLIREYLAAQFSTLAAHDVTGAEAMDYLIGYRHDHAKPDPLPETVQDMWQDVAADTDSLDEGIERVKEQAVAEYGGLPPDLGESIEFYLPPSEVPVVSEWWHYVRNANRTTIETNIETVKRKLDDQGASYVALLEELTRLTAGDITRFEETLEEELDRLAVLIDMDVTPATAIDYYLVEVVDGTPTCEEWAALREVDPDIIDQHITEVQNVLTPPGKDAPAEPLPHPDKPLDPDVE